MVDDGDVVVLQGPVEGVLVVHADADGTLWVEWGDYWGFPQSVGHWLQNPLLNELVELLVYLVFKAKGTQQTLRQMGCTAGSNCGKTGGPL